MIVFQVRAPARPARHVMRDLGTTGVLRVFSGWIGGGIIGVENTHTLIIYGRVSTQ